MSKHSELAKELFKKGYNCAQSVFTAFCDETGLDFDTALKMASSFGAGMGKQREVCGAVSAMFMVTGMKYGYTDPIDKKAKAQLYERVQELAEQFKKENGSIICRELLGLSSNNTTSDDNSALARRCDEGDKEGNRNCRKKRPCVELVEQAARMLDEYIDGQEA